MNIFNDPCFSMDSKNNSLELNEVDFWNFDNIYLISLLL